jgi:hypothetical protein
MSLLDKASLVITPNAVKAGKLYSVIPNTTLGDMDVVRATTATRVNSLGLIESVAVNVPRVDYTNGSCPSLLVEGQRTNLLTYSNDFSNLIWAKVASSTVTTDSGVQNPSGVSPTFRFNASSLAFGGILRQILTLTVGQTYTFSYFAKKGNHRYVGIRFNNARNGERFPTYDFDTDTLNKQGATCDLSRTILANGWVRLSITFTATITTSNCDIALTTSNGDTSTALSGTEFMYVFGAQTELSSFATSYIPTVASTVTRNADVISKTGISSLIGQTEGTLFVDIVYIDVTTTNSISINNGTSLDRVVVFSGSGLLFAQVRVGNVNQFSVNTPVLVGTRYKAAIAYKGSDFAFYVNGNQIAVGSTGTVPTCSVFSYDAGSGGSPFLGKNNSSQLYKTRLTNTELAQLTTL